MSTDKSQDEPMVVRLPSLPGIRRVPLESPPRIFSKTRPKAGSPALSKTAMRTQYEDMSSSMTDNGSLLNSYLEDVSQSITSFPQNAGSLNDTYGRYSIKAHQQDRDTKNLSLPFSNLDTVPSFVINPKGRVCHFSAYFTETFPDNSKELTRIRPVEIIYCVEDNAIEINEPVIRNSGLIQGKVLKKAPVLNPLERRNYRLEDFRAGAELNIYSRIYVVVNADRACKRFMDKLGFPFGEALELPNADGTLPSSQQSAARNSNRNNVSKRLREGDEDVVLKFNGLWNEMEVQLFYKLVDNTISLFGIKDKNPSDKLKAVTILLKNARVVKENLDGTEDETTVLITTADEVGLPSTLETRYFLHWHDIYIGAILPMSGLVVQILDADKNTRKFYSSYNLDLDEPIVVEKQKVELIKPGTPPHNGFGSYDDSLTSCQGSLVPHTMKKNLAKTKQFEGVKLQYRAILISPVEPDENPRQFVIVLFLEDDNIQVLELPEKNSGRAAGAFLSKRKLQHPDGSLAFEKQHFFAGATVKINGYTFFVYHAAKKTLKYMEGHSDEILWTSCNIHKITNKLYERVNEIKQLLLSPSILDENDADEVNEKKKNSNVYTGGYNINDLLSIDVLKSLFDQIAVDYLILQEIITLIRFLTGASNSENDLDDVAEVISVAQLLNLLDSLSEANAY